MKSSDLNYSSVGTTDTDPCETKYFWLELKTCSILNFKFPDCVVLFFFLHLFGFFYFPPFTISKFLMLQEKIVQLERFDKTE